MDKRTCLRCNISFAPRSGNMRFCSAECRQPLKKCVTCGAVLIKALGKRGNGGTDYCSPACRPRCGVGRCHGAAEGSRGWCKSHSAQFRREGIVRPFVHKWAESGGACVVCGDPVKPGGGRRKHCSSACQVADSRHRKAGRARPGFASCQLCKNEINLRGRSASGGRLRRTDIRWCSDCRHSPDALRFKKYGISPDHYLKASARGCAICGAKDRELHVDHDHSCCSAKNVTCGHCVRGLICGPCNRGLGLFGDSADTLRAAIHYLTSHEAKSA